MCLVVVTGRREDTSVTTSTAANRSGHGPTPTHKVELSLEITFRECKQVVGAGQQQVSILRANIEAFHICLWTYTMTEAWAWGREDEELVDRPISPWGKASRRASHADKRRAWRRESQGEEIRAALRPGATEVKIQATAERLLSLAA